LLDYNFLDATDDWINAVLGELSLMLLLPLTRQTWC